MVNYPPTEEEVKRELQFYLHEQKNMKPLLLFYEKLYAKQRCFIQELSTSFLPQTVSKAFRQSKSLLSELVLPIPVEPTLKMAEAILTAACSELVTGNEQQLDLMRKLLQSALTAENIANIFSKPSNLALVNLQQYLLNHHDTAGLSEQQLAVIAQVIRSALQMYFVHFAQQIHTAFDYTSWKEGVCPVCGEKPMLAMLRAEDGGRVLECGLCHTQWETSRILCTACGNTDQQQLSFFFVPAQVHRRVYVCNQCNSYLKTIVLKELARDLIPDLENLVTHYLDVLAANEGYGKNDAKSIVN